MANRAYVRFWTRNDSAESRQNDDSVESQQNDEPAESHQELMLDRFERLLETVPLSAERPDFANLTIRVLNFTETPVAEHDLRGAHCNAAEVIELVRPYTAPDIACEVGAYWDLWRWDLATGRWQHGPEPLLITWNGMLYDDGLAAESGDFLADLGFEHLFTGHAGLLGSRGSRTPPADPVEAEFLALMLREDRLHEYYEKTRLNIQTLLKWVRAAEQALPIERYQLWSEGEENFEARLDEILAVR
ncbi:MAG TPA: hypothetical protein VGH00_08330 [Chthoniobacterales bacterium]|jgi:hypothetical protein